MTLKNKSNLNRIDVAFEIKQFEEEEDFFMFEGYASTFGNLDLTSDIIMPGAFAASIAKSLPVILWQHDSREPIGVTAKAQETTEGLFIRGHLPKDDDFVRTRVMPQLRIGSIKTMSIGFHDLGSELDLEDPRIRRLKEIDLKEVSLVTFPANTQAIITGVKSEQQINIEDVKKMTSPRELEKALRDAGFSKSAAEMVVSKKFNDSLRCDPVNDDVELKLALSSIASKLNDVEIANEISKISQRMNPPC